MKLLSGGLLVSFSSNLRKMGRHPHRPIGRVRFETIVLPQAITRDAKYSIEVTGNGIVITGPSPLGACAVDTPGWGFRGLVLDAARHHCPPDFILEMCSYVSFFKRNKLHLHLSDSPSVDPELTMQEKLDFYSAFRLNSPDPAVTGLIKRVNESYYQADLERRQQPCADKA
ncbi:hypothetical protein LZ554_008754 [Drepanopeziza brunnea f. sp. 'monogermtubi']|nr:hypothetical protein LZ554_008754 [Drepanopeziza brunnea f. sp. 'monogermtubi']